MAKKICTVVGVVFLLVGVAGFAMPNLLGTHLTLAHNIIHLVSGAIALYLGVKGSPGAAVTFCRVFGAVYLLLGVVGFALGSGSDRMLTILPDQLMLGTMDHAVHVLLGLLFLIGGFVGGRTP
ncbi:MAG TPA: DUF4383 domain-containing protein [Thermoanaerobaculia bacterium]|jgi:hypothetical protein|nr:DUF4383 domain-containing protein [Thermoanaerobaculia bacterium]